MTVTLEANVAQNGRLVLPKKVREALGMTTGGKVVFSVQGDEVKLTSIRHSIAQAQALYRRHVKEDRSVDDFLSDRRAEAARDED